MNPSNVTSGPIPDNTHKDPYQVLAAAIVAEACFDYVASVRKLWNKKTSDSVKKLHLIRLMEIDAFFYSEEFKYYSKFEPRYLQKKCREAAFRFEIEAIKRHNLRTAQRELHREGYTLSQESLKREEITANRRPRLLPLDLSR